MRDRCFVDSNVLVYAHDRLSGSKHLRARALLDNLWRSGTGVISTQVLQETCVSLRRKVRFPTSFDEIRIILQNYLLWEVVTNTAESVLRALDIEIQHRISFWDAMIIQAAENSGCAVVYTEDLNHQQVFGSVEAINPFRSQD